MHGRLLHVGGIYLQVSKIVWHFGTYAQTLSCQVLDEKFDTIYDMLYLYLFCGIYISLQGYVLDYVLARCSDFLESCHHLEVTRQPVVICVTAALQWDYNNKEPVIEHKLTVQAWYQLNTCSPSVCCLLLFYHHMVSDYSTIRLFALGCTIHPSALYLHLSNCLENKGNSSPM